MKTTTEPTWYDYDYAVIRVVPRVQLGIFWNVGIILHSRTAGFLEARCRFDRECIAPLCPDTLDLDMLERHLDSYPCICRGEADTGPIGLLPPSERFHWLTAPRSAVIQTSDVHPGRTRDPASCLDQLFKRLVP